MADLGKSPGDYDPVKAGKNPKNPVYMPFRQHDHGRTLHRCRGTCRDNTESIPYPSLRYLFGSGSAGLGVDVRSDQKGEVPMKHEKELTTPAEPAKEERKAQTPFFARKLEGQTLRVKSAIKAGEEATKNAGP
jgi:hypothetical protein